MSWCKSRLWNPGPWYPEHHAYSSSSDLACSLCSAQRRVLSFCNSEAQGNGGLVDRDLISGGKQPPPRVSTARPVAQLHAKAVLEMRQLQRRFHDHGTCSAVRCLGLCPTFAREVISGIGLACEATWGSLALPLRSISPTDPVVCCGNGRNMKSNHFKDAVAG
jgi:hypothetical protein